MGTKQGEDIIAYKGFDKDWSCRGFKYGEPKGQTFTHEGEIGLCKSGFHACEAPLDIWAYFPPVDGNTAALVELGGATEEKDKDTKRVGCSITIKTALSIPALIEAQIEWTFTQAKKTENVKGEGKTVVSSGDYSRAASSGYYSRAASSGYSSNAASSGYSSNAASSGYSSNAASSGDYSRAASSGDSSNAASSGDSSNAASSGDSSKAASSGYSSNAASSGYSSKAASSGDYSKAASSGDYSKAASSGDYSKAACDTNGFACVAGINGRVKGNAGSALSCGYKDKRERNRIAVAYVGENGIKADTWYSVDDEGNFKESA